MAPQRSAGQHPRAHCPRKRGPARSQPDCSTEENTRRDDQRPAPCGHRHSERIGTGSRTPVRHARPRRSVAFRRALRRGIRRAGRSLAGEPRGAGQLGRDRVGDQRAGRGGRAAAGAAGPRAGRGSPHRFRAAEVDPRAGRRGAAACRQGPHHCGDLRAGHPAHPDGRDARPQASRPRPDRSSAGRHRRALTGCHRRGGTQGRRQPRRRAARHRPAHRRRRIPGVAALRHGRTWGQIAHGLGHQCRPGPDGRTPRRVRPGRPHGAAARVVHPQRQAFGRDHRHPGATGPLRALLREDHRERRGRAQEQNPWRCRVPARVQPAQCRGRLPHPASGQRRRARRRVGGPHRPGRRADPGTDRNHLRAPGRLGRRGRGSGRRRRQMDRRPGSQRHRHPPDRTGDPRPGHRHRGGRHARRSAQSVHRRRRSRRRAGLVQLRPGAHHTARRVGQGVDQVHPTHRPFADPAGRYDADHCGRQDRRRRGQRRPLGRARRRGAGDRGDLRCSYPGAGRAPGTRSRDPVQLVVPRPVPVEVAGRRQAAGAEGAPVRRAHRRRGRHRGYPRARGGRRAHRGTQHRRHQPRGVQAGHRRPDQVRHQDRHRGARP